MLSVGEKEKRPNFEQMLQIHPNLFFQDKPQGWFRMDDVIGIGNLVVKSSSNNFLLRCFGPPETDGLGDFELYVALPYASFVEQQERVTISPSVCEL